MPAPILGGGFPSENASVAELIDHVIYLQKAVEFYLDGRLDSKNIHEIAGWYVTQDKFMAKSGLVGLSSVVTGADDIRIWAGHIDPSQAPFRVYESGHVFLSNLTINGGTINWGNVEAPSYFDITGTKPPVNADNTASALPASLGINFTQIGPTYVYTGTLSADQIIAGTLSANYISGGVLSGVVINVSTDATVGHNLYLGTGGGDRGIYFTGPAGIYYTYATDTLNIGAMNGVAILGPLFVDNTDVMSKISSIESQISNIFSILSNKSDVGHTHTVTIPNHNHGITPGSNLATVGGGSAGSFASSGGGVYTTSA